MRISNNMMIENAIQNMSKNLERLQGLQEKVSSGKQFQAVSEDPASASAALSLRSGLSSAQAYLDVSNQADDWFSANENALSQLESVAKEAYNTALAAQGDTNDAEMRKAAGTAIDNMMHQAVDLGNSKLLDQYLFSGTSVNTQPFELINNDSDVVYHGVDGAMTRTITPGQTTTINFNGSAAFQPFIKAMLAVRDALNNNDTAALDTALNGPTGLKVAMDSVTQEYSENGVRQRQNQLNIGRLENTQLQIKKLLSQKEDTNMVEAISAMTNQQTIYQTVLEVGQRAISTSNLFDVLR